MAKCKKFSCIYEGDNGECQDTSESCAGRRCDFWGECGNCAQEYECDEE